MAVVQILTKEKNMTILALDGEMTIVKVDMVTEKDIKGKVEGQLGIDQTNRLEDIRNPDLMSALNVVKKATLLENVQKVVVEMIGELEATFQDVEMTIQMDVEVMTVRVLVVTTEDPVMRIGEMCMV